uniref:ewing's tumor-associated antigen 1 n=1 Tax=Semicossyphus pulcher TaxID=241346 RepID=UPI0037E8F53D
MNRDRRKFGPPSGLIGSPQAATTKPNRLRRSFRQTQQTQTPAEVEPPKGQQSEFKTPTRIPTSRAGGGFSGESPHNDSDCQQDIIWDATSPSPNRFGKRGKKQPPGVVNISEIVSRIAPKHGRPKVAEPTLQQWIGDSATIPCTPDVQAPKPKKKSPRPNGVDDLLKLAKQFDFNMFRQDEEENDFSPLFPGSRQPTVNTAAGRDVQVPLDLQMEDDLDSLFDGPTQHVSGNLSQVSQVKPASKEDSGKPSLQTPGVSKTNIKGSSANDEFEDDWENDDLLNDSLVLEMTQNPQNFSSPRHCSTQKPPCEVKQQRESFPAPPCGSVASAKVEKENVRQRSTFKLESNSYFSVKRAETDAWTKVDYSSRTADRDKQGKLSSGKSVSGEAAAISDLLDDDLNSFFSSDPVWDDPADDDLLCEMCEDVENQIQSTEKKILPMSTQRAALQPATRTWDNRTQQKPFPHQPQTQTGPSRAAGTSYSGGFVPNVAAGAQKKTDSFRYTQEKNTSGSMNSSARLQASSRVQSAPQGNAHTDQFTFKRPNNPVSTVSDKALGKCSAAEIELKKQQAMERRRQRLQATQNLRAPT